MKHLGYILELLKIDRETDLEITTDDMQLEAYGGAEGIREKSLLESALMNLKLHLVVN